MLYFVEGETVGPHFGFPRVKIKKKFRWYPLSFSILILKGKR